MNEVVRELLTGTVLPGLGAVVLTVLVGLAREWAKELRDARLRRLLLALVQAAEQIYGPGKGEAKRRYVREKLKEKGLSANREEVEAAVFSLNGVNP